MAFFVFDTEDPWNEAGHCSDENDLREFLKQRFCHGIHPTILEYEEDGFTRNVTEQFRPERKRDPFYGDYSNADHFGAMLRNLKVAS